MPPTPTRRRATAVAVSLLLTLLAGACSDDAEAPGPTQADESEAVAGDTTSSTRPDCDTRGETSSAEPTTSVQVMLTEYAVAPDAVEVPAGTIELVAVNQGMAPHELAVVRYDGDPAALPLNPVDGVDETQLPEGAVLGRLRSFDAGLTCDATFDLTPGRYILLCNLVDDASNPHYIQGMWSAFTVT